jgi:heat-inducible transcriptional repressor
MLPQSLSPATIRNVMSDLEHLGLIHAPHVSAGRLPTQQGLRFFVDAFMEIGDISDDERRVIEAQVEASGRDHTIEHMLTEASQMLSGMSRGAGLVLATKSEVPLKHIEFIQLEPSQGAGGAGLAEWRRGEPRRRIAGRRHRLAASRGQQFPQRPYSRPHAFGGARGDGALKERPGLALDTLSQDLVERGLAIWAGTESGLPARLIVRGRANLLENVTAQADLERLKLLFEDLETKEGLIRLLDLAEEGSGVRIFIGSENKLFSLSGSSLVVAPYRDKDAASSARSASSVRRGSTMRASCRWSTTRPSSSAGC